MFKKQTLRTTQKNVKKYIDYFLNIATKFEKPLLFPNGLETHLIIP